MAALSCDEMAAHAACRVRVDHMLADVGCVCDEGHDEDENRSGYIGDIEPSEEYIESEAIERVQKALEAFATAAEVFEGTPRRINLSAACKLIGDVDDDVHGLAGAYNAFIGPINEPIWVHEEQGWLLYFHLQHWIIADCFVDDLDDAFIRCPSQRGALLGGRVMWDLTDPHGDQHTTPLRIEECSTGCHKGQWQPLLQPELSSERSVAIRAIQRAEAALAASVARQVELQAAIDMENTGSVETQQELKQELELLEHLHGPPADAFKPGAKKTRTKKRGK